MPFGAIELLLILIVVLIAFGPGRLPKAFQAIGRGIADLRGAATDDDPLRDDEGGNP